MIDTHCHIDLYEAPIVIADAAEAQRIKTVAVTYLPSHYELAKRHLASYGCIHPALGLHPLAANDHEKEIPVFRRLISEAKFVGEIGLDFSGAGKGTRARQESSFALVVDSLRGKKCFVTVHSRGAEDAVLSILKAAGVGPVVFHWFSGSKKQLERVIDAGHYVSFNTAMVAAGKWVDLVRVVPKTAILTESDGPFIRFGDRPACPSDMGVIVRWLAAQWQMSVDAARDQVERNFEALVSPSAGIRSTSSSGSRA